MYFEKDLPTAATFEVRGLDVDGNSISVPLTQFLTEITNDDVIIAIIEQYEKDKGIRLVDNGDSWGTETWDGATWTATGFEEPL